MEDNRTLDEWLDDNAKKDNIQAVQEIKEVAPMKWRDLKNFILLLDDYQLDQDIIYWGDDKGGFVFNAIVLGETWINPSGEGAEPISTYLNDLEGTGKTIEELRAEPPVARRGDCRLMIM